MSILVNSVFKEDSGLFREMRSIFQQLEDEEGGNNIYKSNFERVNRDYFDYNFKDVKFDKEQNVLEIILNNKFSDWKKESEKEFKAILTLIFLK